MRHTLIFLRALISLPTVQDEIIMSNLRGAAVIIGALMHRLEVEQVVLHKEELAKAISPSDVLITDNENGDKTIRLRRTGR